MRQGEKWTDAEIETFKRMLLDGIGYREIAERLGRGYGAVKARSRKLDMTHVVHRAGCWTAAELEILARHGTRNPSEIADLLPGRSVSAIKKQRVQMRQMAKAAPEPVVEKHRLDRPLWVPFVTASGVKAIRTEAGVVPFVSLIHDPGHALTSSPA